MRGAFPRWRRRSMRVIRSASANAAAPRTAMSARETLAERGFATSGGLASTAVTDAVWRDRATGSVKLGPPRAGGGTATRLLAPPREVTTGDRGLGGRRGQSPEGSRAEAEADGGGGGGSRGRLRRRLRLRLRLRRRLLLGLGGHDDRHDLTRGRLGGRGGRRRRRPLRAVARRRCATTPRGRRAARSGWRRRPTRPATRVFHLIEVPFYHRRLRSRYSDWVFPAPHVAVRARARARRGRASPSRRWSPAERAARRRP